MWLIFLLFFNNSTRAAETSAACINWFKYSKIVTDADDCILKCQILKINMETFSCTSECEDLCSPKSSSSILGNFIFYPGLTPAERKLVQKYPIDAVTVYFQKNLAENSANRNFPDQSLNDEADAFRHFMWAGLLTKEMGLKKAKKFLDAHEADPEQPTDQKNMDIFNNNRGQLGTQILIKEDKWSLRELEAKGLDELRTDKLRVLKHGLKIPLEPK